MKKILLSVLLVLVIGLFITTVVAGIGFAKVPSIGKLNSETENLKNNIDSYKDKSTNQFDKAVGSLSVALKKCEQAKNEYEQTVELCYGSKDEFAEQDLKYTKEFLLVKLGTYFKENGLKGKFELNSLGVDSKYDLNITLQGPYMGVIDFCYAIEDDSFLNFKIENLSIIPSGDGVQATFSCKNLTVLN